MGQNFPNWDNWASLSLQSKKKKKGPINHPIFISPFISLFLNLKPKEKAKEGTTKKKNLHHCEKKVMVEVHLSSSQLHNVLLYVRLSELTLQQLLLFVCNRLCFQQVSTVR